MLLEFLPDMWAGHGNHARKFLFELPACLLPGALKPSKQSQLRPQRCEASVPEI